MFTKVVLPALVAIGSVSAQSATCTVSTTTINSQADATALAGCRTVRGSVVIAPDAGPIIDISGPSQITGDLTLSNNGVIESFKASDLTIIGGDWNMKNVTRLSSLEFDSITKVQSLDWQTLNALERVTFGGAGLTEAERVIISDTFLNTLDGVDLTSVREMNINNNRFLTEFSTQLGNVSEALIVSANGFRLKVTMPNLIWINNMTMANVTEFSAPSLETVNGSARFDSNYFTTFSAPNLTSIQSGDLSFVGNANLENVSFPALTRMGGGLLIANNTALEELDGFPKLRTIGGAVKLRGSFKEAAFPALNDVKGAFDISSTEDISASCDAFDALSGDKKIQGTFNCESNNAAANEDTDSTTGTGSGGTSGGKDKNAASGVTFSTALLGLAALAGLAQAL